LGKKIFNILLELERKAWNSRPDHIFSEFVWSQQAISVAAEKLLLRTKFCPEAVGKASWDLVNQEKIVGWQIEGYEQNFREYHLISVLRVLYFMYR
jgi:hypothetical protein